MKYWIVMMNKLLCFEMIGMVFVGLLVILTDTLVVLILIQILIGKTTTMAPITTITFVVARIVCLEQTL